MLTGLRAFRIPSKNAKNMPIWFTKCGSSKAAPVTIVINGSNGTTTTIDLSKLDYFPNDAAAGAGVGESGALLTPVPIKGYYLASEDNTMGLPKGSLKRREY